MKDRNGQCSTNGVEKIYPPGGCVWKMEGGGFLERFRKSEVAYITRHGRARTLRGVTGEEGAAKPTPPVGGSFSGPPTVGGEYQPNGDYQ